MAKRRRAITQKVIVEWLKDGRGQGEGPDYKSLYTIQSVASRGRVHRIKGWKHGRVHHLLSDLEKYCFLIFEWMVLIIDIREQFPLLPQEETLAIADEIGVRHPRDPVTKYPVVMTTDLLLTEKQNQKLGYYARAVKYWDDLRDSRTIEKLEIERRYWLARGINWRIMTERHISPVFVDNVWWAHPYFLLTDLYPLSANLIEDVALALTQKVLTVDAPLREITRQCDAEFGLERGWSLSIVRHLIANKRWEIDMYSRFRTSQRLILTNVRDVRLDRERRKVA